MGDPLEASEHDTALGAQGVDHADEHAHRPLVQKSRPWFFSFQLSPGGLHSIASYSIVG